jgi:hypothetical protein
MGGKGGGGGGGGGMAGANTLGLDSTSHPGYWIDQNGQVSDATGMVVGTKDSMWPEAAPVAAAAPAPVAAPAAVEAPAPAAPAGDPGPAKNDTLAPSVAGGGTDAADPAAPGGAGSGVNTDTAGSTLGGSVLNPPKYWTGNASKFKSGSASSQGKMTTTNT